MEKWMTDLILVEYHGNDVSAITPHSPDQLDDLIAKRRRALHPCLADHAADHRLGT